MRCCPVCEKELTQGLVCDNCGFDLSCGYERNRTLCSALPKGAEPVSVCAAKWKRRKQTATETQSALVCPKCGGTSFSFLIDELQFMCLDCGAKMPVTAPTGGSVPGNGLPVEQEPPAVPDDPSTTGENAEGPAPPRTIEKKGVWWKSLYPYEWTLIICWVVLLAHVESYPLENSVYPMRGLMVIPLILSFAVTKDKLRKNTSAGSIMLRLFMAFTAAVLVFSLCSEAVQLGDLPSTVLEYDSVLDIYMVTPDEQYLQEKNLFLNNLIVGVTMGPLVLQMYRHWGQERKKSKGIN